MNMALAEHVPAPVATSQRMSDAEYEVHRARLRNLYGDSNAEANAKRDQGLAILFYLSGWTQEQLAAKEGMSQKWIDLRLRFGRFLSFSTTVLKSESLPKSLTERRFRLFWSQTDKDGNERVRFREAARLIEEHDSAEKVRRGISGSHRNFKLGPSIMEHFADGKWHPEESIIAKIAPDEPLRVRRSLQLMLEAKTYKSKCERKMVGGKPRWRIFAMEKTVSVKELIEKLGPIIEGLKLEGKKNMATISISDVARFAALLQRQLDEWSK
jgi:hypothetical protein